jgi:hypothetical protein
MVTFSYLTILYRHLFNQTEPELSGTANAQSAEPVPAFCDWGLLDFNPPKQGLNHDELSSAKRTKE